MPRGLSATRHPPNGLSAKPAMMVQPSPPDFNSPGEAASRVTQRSCKRPGPESPEMREASSTLFPCRSSGFHKPNRIRTRRRSNHENHVRLFRQFLHSALPVRRRVADVFLRRFLDVGIFPLQGLHEFFCVINRERRLRQNHDFFIRYIKFFNILKGLDWAAANGARVIYWLQPFLKRFLSQGDGRPMR